MSAAAWAGGTPLTRIAFCWKLVRADGLVLGFTSHDRDLWRDGLMFRAAPGMTPSAVTQEERLGEGSLGVEGVLSAAAVSAPDIEAGRWDGARAELFACDWTDVAAPLLPLMKGRIGEIVRSMAAGSGAFAAEMALTPDGDGVGEAVRLSPLCRASLGDGRCGVDLAPLRRRALVAAGAGRELWLAEAPGEADGLAGGSIRLLDGWLAGVDRRIEAVEGSRLLLEEPVPGGDLAGMRVLLTPGCDRRFQTCRERFQNGAAFDGEPHVPGTDLLLRYAEA